MLWPEQKYLCLSEILPMTLTGGASHFGCIKEIEDKKYLELPDPGGGDTTREVCSNIWEVGASLCSP